MKLPKMKPLRQAMPPATLREYAASVTSEAPKKAKHHPACNLGKYCHPKKPR